MELFDYLINIYECLIITLFLYTWSSKDKKHILVKTIFLFIFELAFITIINQYLITDGILDFIDMIICFTYLYFSSTLNIGEVLMISLLPSLIIGVTNSLYTIILFTIFQTNNYFEAISNNRIIIFLIINLIHGLVLYVVQKLMHKHQFSLAIIDAFIASLILWLCNFFSTAFESVYLDLPTMSKYVTYGAVSLLLMCGLFALLLFRISNKKAQELKTNYELAQLKQQLLLNMKVLDAKQELYQLKHDIKHFISLLDLAKANANSETYKQSQKLLEKIGKSTYPIFTPCPPLTTVLNLKRDEALNKSIDFKCAINLTRTIQMDETDLYLLLSNILDNSIEHIGNQKKLSIDIREQGEYCSFLVENSYDPNNVNPPSKEHGYGIPTIKTIVNKYDGMVTFIHSETTYTVKMMLLVNIN